MKHGKSRKHFGEHIREQRKRFSFLARSFTPSVLSVMNMVCGYIALVMSGGHQFAVAAWFIVFAALFDTADGFVARKTSTASRFGAELDSLSDLVSFGAAPAYLVYQFGLQDLGAISGILISSMLLVGSGLRLARFNSTLPGYSKDSFFGLPAPAQALTVAGYILWISAEPFLNPHQVQNTLLLLTVVLTVLMVSKVNYDALPKPTLAMLKEKPVQTVLYIAAFAALCLYQVKALFLAMILYILLGVVRSLSLFFRGIVFEE